VVQKAISVTDQWDSLLKTQRKIESVQPIIVEFFQWHMVPHGRAPLTSGTTAKIVAYNDKQDLALVYLRLKDEIRAAKLLPENMFNKVRIGTGTWAVGCALLHTPIMTSGIVSSIGDIANGVEFDMSSSAIVFGNSGGGMFADIGGEFYFIGVPSLVDVVGWGTPITHCGYYSPIRRIYEDFFKAHMFDFLVPGSGKTEAQCEAERKAKIEKQEQKRY
jgi:hypothetical protein